MSGIYIPGMKMPEAGCKSCAFDIYGSCLIKANMDKPYEVTHSCPLIELPPHGRLGDLDALCEGRVSNDPVVIHAKTADTIIPADREEDT